MSSFPVVSDGRRVGGGARASSCRIRTRARLDASVAELESERDAVRSSLGLLSR